MADFAMIGGRMPKTRREMIWRGWVRWPRKALSDWTLWPGRTGGVGSRIRGSKIIQNEIIMTVCMRQLIEVLLILLHEIRMWSKFTSF